MGQWADAENNPTRYAKTPEPDDWRIWAHDRAKDIIYISDTTSNRVNVPFLQALKQNKLTYKVFSKGMKQNLEPQWYLIEAVGIQAMDSALARGAKVIEIPYHELEKKVIEWTNAL